MLLAFGGFKDSLNAFCFKDILAGKLQGQAVICHTEGGNIKVKSVYADNSKFTSSSGCVMLNSCHGNSSVAIESGDLNVGEYNLIHIMRKPVFGFPTRPNTNQAVQPQRMVRGFKFLSLILLSTHNVNISFI